MKKVGIIVQRYGTKVNGGAEVHARMIAEQLSQKYEVTVLTSCAQDYFTWEPVYKVGEEVENGIRIIRFQNSLRGTKSQLKYARRKASGRLLIQKIHRLLGKPSWLERWFSEIKITDADHEKWLQYQGPYMPTLLNYLAEHTNEYAAYIFFTALYYPTAMGVQVCPDKSILVPTMHDEKPSYMPGYKKVMSSPSWILFNTATEKIFSEKLFPIDKINKRIVGVGIDLLKDTFSTLPVLPPSLSLQSPYIVYIGRVDANKGCDVLIDYFHRYQKQTNSTVQLVMVGKKILEGREEKNVHFTGFVDDHTKNVILMHAEALVIPSFFESLSLVLLESMGAGKPVIANGKTEVLREHIEKSEAGWMYFNYEDFKKAMNELLHNPEGNKVKGKKGYTYVQQNYTWKKVLEYYDEAIQNVSKD